MLPDRIGGFLERLDRFIETDPLASAHVLKGLEAFIEGTGARAIPAELSEMARGFSVYAPQ